MTWLNTLKSPSPNLGFHAYAIAGLVTGAFMVFSAGDMGAMAPLIISGGIFLSMFFAAAELVFLLRHVAAKAAHAFLSRLGKDSASGG